ncbi:MAG: esterase-like activity of phytase family protein, partial [Sphingomonas sp.]
KPPAMRVVLLIALIWLLVPHYAGLSPNPRLNHQVPFSLTPVAIRRDGGNRVGQLRFLRGYRLASADPAFGGWSSLLVEGDRFTLLSDGGELIRFRLDDTGRMSAPEMFSLPTGPGTGWTKDDRDSESMVRDPATGRLWVGFENWNAIWRYAPGFARAERHVEPPAMQQWPPNGGPETMARLADGRFLVIAEQVRDTAPPSVREALLFDRDPTETRHPPLRFSYMPPPGGFDPSDATQLPDGRIILLNRRLHLPDGFEVAVSIIDPRAIRPGATVKGSEIARFAGDVLHDNYEGIAVGADAGGPVIWIVSDDNQNMFQQSLLLAFRLDPATR